MLVLGASGTMVSISPLILYDETGIAAYNRSSSLQIPQVSYLNLQETLKAALVMMKKCLVFNPAVLYNGTVLLAGVYGKGYDAASFIYRGF